MGFRQWRVIDSFTTESNDSGTVKIKLPKSNFLHTLLIRCQIDNGATNAQSQHMSDVVDSVKVVANGSEVLAYLEPETIRATALKLTGANIPEIIDERGGATQEAVYPIFFGPGWFDPNHYLPLDAFDDLELQIEFSPTIDAASFATGTFDHEVLGLMSMDGPAGAYEGTLRSRIIKNFTTAASGDEEVEPAQSNPWHSLLVRCYEAGIADGVDLTNVKFDANDGVITFLDLSWDALVDLNKAQLPLNLVRKLILDQTDADTTNVDQSRILSVQCNDLEADVLTTVETIAGDQLTIQQTDQSSQAVDEGGAATYTIHAAETADNAFEALIHSEQIPFTVFLPLDQLVDGELLDSKAYDNLKLTLTQGAAGGDTDVVLVEVAQYG